MTNLVLEVLKLGRLLTLLFPVCLNTFLVPWKWTISEVVMKVAAFYTIEVETFNLTVLVFGVRGD